MKKLENFKKALDNLELCKEYAAPYDVVTKTGLVNLFSICFEQSWKAMKELLDRRNEVAHSYNEEVAIQIIEGTKEKYLLLFEALISELEANWL